MEMGKRRLKIVNWKIERINEVLEGLYIPMYQQNKRKWCFFDILNDKYEICGKNDELRPMVGIMNLKFLIVLFRIIQ